MKQGLVDNLLPFIDGNKVGSFDKIITYVSGQWLFLSSPVFSSLIIMSKKVLILGHSFVRRLEQFVINSVDSRVNENLNLDCDEVCVYYRGHSGASLQRIRALGISYVRELRPDITIIHALSNELCKRDRTVDAVFRELVDFVISLRYGESVKSVVILQTLHRLAPVRRIRYGVNVHWFNSRVDALNGRI